METSSLPAQYGTHPSSAPRIRPRRCPSQRLRCWPEVSEPTARTAITDDSPSGHPSITASALSRDTSAFDRRLRFVRSRFFVFLPEIFSFSPTKARIVNPAVERWFHQPSIRSSTTDHDSCFELPACAGRQGAQSKRRSHLRDQGAPRATLHGSHLRARGCGAQHPVQLHGKFACHGHFGHARALVKFQSSIHTL